MKAATAIGFLDLLTRPQIEWPTRKRPKLKHQSKDHQARHDDLWRAGSQLRQYQVYQDVAQSV